MSIETEKMELRSSIKALTFRKGRVACRIAEDVGITGYFFSDELPLDDPRVSPVDVEQFRDLDARLYDAHFRLEQLEFEPERAQARQTCFDFIKLLSLDEAAAFLESVGCTSTMDLTEKLIHNPNLIEEVYL